MDKINIPFISICIPTYNRATFLNTTLNMFLEEFSESNIEYEILVGDNASTDDTPDLMKKFVNKYSQIYYFRHKHNLGITRNLNFLFYKAKGHYLWLWGDDDLVYKDSVKCILKCLNEYSPNVVLLNTDNMRSLDNFNKNWQVIYKNRLSCQKDNYYFENIDVHHLDSNFFEWMYITNLLSTIIINRDKFLKELKNTKLIIDDDNAYQFQHAVLSCIAKYQRLLIMGQSIVLHRKNETFWSKKIDRILKVNLYDSQEVYKNLSGLYPENTLNYYRNKFLRGVLFLLIKYKKEKGYIDDKFLVDYKQFVREIDKRVYGTLAQCLSYMNPYLAIVFLKLLLKLKFYKLLY